MHHANIQRSERLRRVLAALSSGQWITTMALGYAAKSTRPSSDVSELRHSGVEVDCEYVGPSETGARVHKYRLAKK